MNRRTVFGAVLVAVSLAGGHVALERGDMTTPVWVAARNLAGGSTVTGDNVRVEHVHLTGALARAYVAADQPIDGYVVTRPVAAGELLPTRWVAPHAPGEGRAVTVPVDPEHAVGGALQPGDLIDIFATFNPGDVRARTVALVREVEVVEIVASGGLVMGEKTVVGITVSVSPDDAQRLAFASRTAEVDIARIDDPSQSGGRAVVRGADL